MPRQTRRSAKAREPQSSSEEDNSQVVMNGNGIHHASEHSDAAKSEENIFVFWPNIIGEPQISIREPTARILNTH